MQFKELASKRNLELAWRRITTGANLQYKDLYRHLYFTYEVALESNLEDLRQRIAGGSFKAQLPDRIYIPKASGLHRPLALLHIEDQIVLQAFANLAAKRIHPKRRELQFKVIFSNILQEQDSIFFFRRWQDTYHAYGERVHAAYESGLRWVGDFDLAAFYDTVSHALLLKTIYPKSSSDALDWIRECLGTWSSPGAASGHGHGIPQGPLASDFLAECFLLPIDKAMAGSSGYIRYVDDVRLLGSSEDDVRKSLIDLERLCRERGLIPQTGKFAIKLARDAGDAMGMLPSLADPQHLATSERMDPKTARTTLLQAVDGKPYKVKDKTRLRYVLYRADPDNEILRLVLLLIPRHPEHVDVFFTYLSRFGRRRPIEALCQSLVQDSPYSHVRGEAWHLLSRYVLDTKSSTRSSSGDWANRAISVVKAESPEAFSEHWGAAHFLCSSEDIMGRAHTRFLKFLNSSLLQGFLGPLLPDSAFRPGEAAEAFLKRTSPEAGLGVAPGLLSRGLKPNNFGLRTNQLPTQVSNVLRELGVIQSSRRAVDPIAEVLFKRYGTPQSGSWHTLLDAEYVHAAGLLRLAEATFDSGRSFWLADSRQDIVP